MTPMILKKLVAKYVYAAMVAWVPLTSHYERDKAGHFLHNEKGYFVQEDQAEVQQRYEDTASDIAEVTLGLPPLFTTGDNERQKTSLLLGAVASFEGGFNKWVDDGTCNTKEFQDRAKKQDRPECDGGSAWTIWQLHMYEYIFKDGEMVQARWLRLSSKKEDRDWIKEHESEIITGPQLIADRKLAVKVAYFVMKDTLRAHQSLCGYSGESCSGAHPLATLRFDRAKDYNHNHPFVLPSGDQLEALEAMMDLQDAERTVD